jgi:DMSO/TMAO reductase YedYZ molybdopterin-dependent catalytic subunit
LARITEDMASLDEPVRAADAADREGRFARVPAPPGPFRARFWRSPLRGPWLTAVLGSILLVLLAVVVVTGFLSHAAYESGLGGNRITDDLPLPFVDVSWPAGVSWLYALNQGLHTVVGVATVPFLLAKLWSVIPRLFAWPPVTSPAQAVERLSITLLVGSAGFQFATGVVNMQVYYPFRFDFVVAHYWGAVVFTAALVLHVAVKLPAVRRAYRARGVLRPLRDDLAHTRPEPRDPDGLVSRAPAEPTLSRRGLLAFTGAGAAALVASTAGQSIGGPLRQLAFLAPRRQSFPVNKTFAAAAIPARAVAAEVYRLRLGGPDGRALSRAELLALPQHTETLTLGCVEGWSTTQTWTGVRLVDLAELAGFADAATMTAVSLQPRGVLREATLSRAQWSDPRALLALKVNGEDLSLDHGFPARVMAPGVPGVHNTKWVGRLSWA